MIKVDLSKYKRKTLYMAFKDRELPCFSVTNNIDITHLKNYLFEKSFGFFIPISFLISKSMNDITEMRHRIIEGELYEFDVIDPGYTILLDDETFSFCDSRYFDNFLEYQNYASLKIAEVKNNSDHGAQEKHHMFFISNIPWFSFTSISHPFSSKYCSLPIVSIGKYFSQNNNIFLPVGIQVHHGLVDGIHVAKFYSKLSYYCSTPHLII